MEKPVKTAWGDLKVGGLVFQGITRVELTIWQVDGVSDAEQTGPTPMCAR